MPSLIALLIKSNQFTLLAESVAWTQAQTVTIRRPIFWEIICSIPFLPFFFTKDIFKYLGEFSSGLSRQKFKPSGKCTFVFIFPDVVPCISRKTLIFSICVFLLFTLRSCILAALLSCTASLDVSLASVDRKSFSRVTVSISTRTINNLLSISRCSPVGLYWYTSGPFRIINVCGWKKNGNCNNIAMSIFWYSTVCIPFTIFHLILTISLWAGENNY